MTFVCVGVRDFLYVGMCGCTILSSVQYVGVRDFCLLVYVGVLDFCLYMWVYVTFVCLYMWVYLTFVCICGCT